MNLMDILYPEVLPWVLRFVIVGLGLTLSPADLKRVVVLTRAVIAGLIGQLALLPLLAFGLALLLAPTPEIAVSVTSNVDESLAIMTVLYAAAMSATAMAFIAMARRMLLREEPAVT